MTPELPVVALPPEVERVLFWLSTGGGRLLCFDREAWKRDPWLCLEGAIEQCPVEIVAICLRDERQYNELTSTPMQPGMGPFPQLCFGITEDAAGPFAKDEAVMWYPIDKSDWPAASGEPDMVAWQVAIGGDRRYCLAVRGPMGSWNGYTMLGWAHPWSKLTYDDDGLCDVLVHGGLTFGAEHTMAVFEFMIDNPASECKWIGFDCGHAFDLMPKPVPGVTTTPRSDIYRDLAFVKAEVESMARQVVEAWNYPMPEEKRDFEEEAAKLEKELDHGG